MSWISGSYATAFGRLAGRSSLDLMTEAATHAVANAALERADIDGIVCGHSTTMPHLMLATVFAEHFGIAPRYAHGVQQGGASGLAMVMLAGALVDAGVVEHMLVVAGENRLTGQSRDTTIETLAQVGHPVYEVPLGLTVPAYYALVASRYLHESGATQEDLAELAVLMRRHAAAHPGAGARDPLSVEAVMNSKMIAAPLKLLDCCPISDGGAAVVVSRVRTSDHSIRILGAAQAHTHQHATAAPSLTRSGARASATEALARAKRAMSDIDYLGIYDSFTVTLALLLEELGISESGRAGSDARDGRFDRDGALPLNTHGGLLSYGHCGVAGSLGHLVEAHLQLTGRAGRRQVRRAAHAFLHGDGGILSSHVSVVLEGAR